MTESVIKEAKEIEKENEERIRSTPGFENARIFMFCEGVIAFGPGGILALHDMVGRYIFMAQDVRLDFYSDDNRGQYYCVLCVSDNIGMKFEFLPSDWASMREIHDEIKVLHESIKKSNEPKISGVLVIKKKLKDFLSKYKWWILGGIVFLLMPYPFTLLGINRLTGFSIGELYTFGVPLKDFLTPWVAFWGIFGAAFGIYQMQKRISIQEGQLDEQRNQFQTQIEVQEKQLRDNRFSSGVELLGNDNESTRIGGAYSLYFLARDNSEYAEAVCEIFCAYIRTKTSDKKYQKEYIEQPSNEIHTILGLLFERGEKDDLIFYNYYKDLYRIFLCGFDFFDTNLNNVSFFEARLRDMYFKRSELDDVRFDKARLKDIYFEDDLYGNNKLIGVGFKNAILNNVKFAKAILMDVDFSDAILDKETVKFDETKLADCDFDEITREGRSLELTKDDDLTKLNESMQEIEKLIREMPGYTDSKIFFFRNGVLVFLKYRFIHIRFLDDETPKIFDIKDVKSMKYRKERPSLGDRDDAQFLCILNTNDFDNPVIKLEFMASDEVWSKIEYDEIEALYDILKEKAEKN